jgi:hypothetical protein
MSVFHRGKDVLIDACPTHPHRPSVPVTSRTPSPGRRLSDTPRVEKSRVPWRQTENTEAGRGAGTAVLPYGPLTAGMT